jgi:hypothetical protein
LDNLEKGLPPGQYELHQRGQASCIDAMDRKGAHGGENHKTTTIAKIFNLI